jgi:lipid-binding SYLF domain-containing protein
MKKVLLGFGLALTLVLPASPQDKEQDRVENAGTVMKEILNAPDGIPQSVLDKADCVVILPSVLKFAIGIGGSYGRGVMTCRGGSTFHGKWGAPTMMALEGGKRGTAIGRQRHGLHPADDEPAFRKERAKQQGEDRGRCFSSGRSGGAHGIGGNRCHPAC